MIRLSGRKWCHGRKWGKWIRKVIQLDKKVSQMAVWKYPSLMRNVGLGKSKSSLSDGYSKLLAEQRREENLYVCDGKNDEIIRVVVRLFEIIKCESDSHRIGERFHRWKIMEQQYDSKGVQVDLLVIDEFAALNCTLNKKRICRNQWQFKKKNYIDG